MPADDPRSAEPVETYALARRGLPLPLPASSVLRASWLPAVIRRRALPIEARVIPLPARNDNGRDQDEQDPNEPELAADFAEANADVGRPSTAPQPAPTESMLSRASAPATSTKAATAPMQPTTDGHGYEPQPSLPNWHDTQPSTGSGAMLDSGIERKPNADTTGVPKQGMAVAELGALHGRTTSFDPVRTPKQPTARQHADDMALPVQAGTSITDASSGREASRQIDDLTAAPKATRASDQVSVKASIKIDRQPSLAAQMPTPSSKHRAPMPPSRDDGVARDHIALTRAPTRVMGLPVAADHAAPVTRADGSAARAPMRSLEAAELAALQAPPAPAVRPLQIDRVQVLVQAPAAANPHPASVAAITSSLPPSPRANAPAAYRNPWSSYFTRRD